MKNNNDESRPQDERLYEQIYGLNSVESSTEFTGLTPSLPLEDEEMDSYSDMESMPYQSNKKYKKK